MTEETLCRRCAASGRTCCQAARVFVTQGDVARIRAATGEEDFWEMAVPDGDELAVGRALDPVWGRVFGPDGRWRVLQHRAGAEAGPGCVFLTQNGCSLAPDVRPLVCRLYPFDYNETTIKGIYGPVCPAPERDNGPLLLALLEMGRDAAEAWRRRLYEEIRSEFPG